MITTFVPSYEIVILFKKNSIFGESNVFSAREVFEINFVPTKKSISYKMKKKKRE